MPEAESASICRSHASQSRSIIQLRSWRYSSTGNAAIVCSSCSRRVIATTPLYECTSLNNLPSWLLSLQSRLPMVKNLPFGSALAHNRREMVAIVAFRIPIIHGSRPLVTAKPRPTSLRLLHVAALRFKKPGASSRAKRFYPPTTLYYFFSATPSSLSFLATSSAWVFVFTSLSM